MMKNGSEMTNEKRKVSGCNNLLKKITTPAGFLKLALVLLMLLFIIAPIIAIFTNMRAADWVYVFTDSNFGYGILYSIIYSLVGAAISVVLATVASYLLSRSNLKSSKLFAILLTAPMLIPTISIGLGIRNIFGAQGLGMGALIIGSAITGFPIAFMLISDALQYENRSVYDACESLGIKKRTSFWNITIPYLKKTLISAFIATSIWVFTDYGLPLEVAGNIPTLPTYLYKQAVGLYQYGRGSVIGIVLILPSIGGFIFNQISKENSQEESAKQITEPAKYFKNVSLIVLIFLTVIILLPQIIFLIIAFSRNYPNDLTFTFQNFINAFSPNSATNIWSRIGNSLLLAFFTGVFGSFFAYIAAYFSTRSKGMLSKTIDFLALLSLAIPGLVLGLGYVGLFNGTNGWFYGTLAILVTVNCAHFFSSPYLMAKNALSKINKDYETVGETLNASRFKIFREVLLPNSFSTIIRMFSYFFINAMITISAISFLVEYFNTPLSIEITRYQKDDNYQMQAVISIIILLINIIVKIGLEWLSNLVDKKNNKIEDKEMALTHNEFRVLACLKTADKALTKKEIIKEIKQSPSVVTKVLNDFLERHAVIKSGRSSYSITNHGSILIEPYRVRKAIIIAAGFGSRMAPVTLDTPKPLVTVNGKRIIDTLLDALYAQDIKNIYIIRGYLGEQFDQLLEKYPTIKFIENPHYNEANNISSMFMAKNIIDRCYVCEADLVISNPNIIKKYQYRTNYLGFKVKSTDDWCFFTKGKYIDTVSVGGEDCVQMVGISYWNQEDSEKLKIDIQKVWNSHGGKENYWDNVPLKIKKKNYHIAIRECNKTDVMEIDNFSELVALDSSYKNYKNKNN